LSEETIKSIVMYKDIIWHIIEILIIIYLIITRKRYGNEIRKDFEKIIDDLAYNAKSSFDESLQIQKYVADKSIRDWENKSKPIVQSVEQNIVKINDDLKNIESVIQTMIKTNNELTKKDKIIKEKNETIEKQQIIIERKSKQIKNLKGE